LGLPCLYHHQLISSKRYSTAEEVSVFLFGLVLFEMATGKEYLPIQHLEKPPYPEELHPEIKKV